MTYTTEVQTIEAVSTPKVWGSATASVNVGDIIHSPFMPVMRVMDKQTGDEGTWLLVEPTNAAYPKEWIEVEDIQQPAAAKPLSRNREIQTIEAFGVSYTEYRHEAELPEDEPIATSLTCGQCDYYQAGRSKLSQGNCTLLRQLRASGDIACPQLAITAPF